MVSLTAQLAALRVIETRGHAHALVRAGFANRQSEGELLHEQITAARETFERIAESDTVRRAVERLFK